MDYERAYFDALKEYATDNLDLDDIYYYIDYRTTIDEIFKLRDYLIKKCNEIKQNDIDVNQITKRLK